jgi:hypothetical protein
MYLIQIDVDVRTTTTIVSRITFDVAWGTGEEAYINGVRGDLMGRLDRLENRSWPVRCLEDVYMY